MSDTVRAHPYPYTIPPVQCPSTELARRLDPWAVLEFLRIEALLRSPTVMKLYGKTYASWKKKCPKGTDSRLVAGPLSKQYRVLGDWEILNGAHHKHLQPTEDSLVTPARAVTDLGAMARLEPDTFESDLKLLVEAHSKQEGTDSLLLLIDTACPPEAILKGLRPVLQERHNRTQRRTSSRVPKMPPIYGVKTWLDYFRCYDLRYRDGLTFGAIAEQVYGKKKDRDRAEKAFVRVQRLIVAAERNDWPPSKL